ncbi:MAG: PASTA domain-containing protein [Coriobacteriaceae bacterium]|jgi:serine/threonine-protein kinase|nr:PASTA domain-containing protein [Coriobacteriaceae bacterium]
MICTLCGSENKDSAKFCNECGAVLRAPSRTDGSKAPLGPFAPPPPAADGLQDLSGLDEYLVEGDYLPPKASWRTGDTMELPRLADEPKPQKEFRAPAAPLKRKSKRPLAFGILLALVAIAFVVVSYGYQSELWGGRSLPDVVGKDSADARAILEERGFTVKALEVKSDDTEGIVLLMDPGAGKRLSEGSEVVLQVATPRLVPDVVGKPLDKAKEAFEQEGFGRVEYVKVKSNEPENTVLAIEPAAGSKLTAQTPILVTLAEPFIVPESQGLDLASAIALIEQEGLVAEAVYVYSEAEEGTVVASEPAAGTRLPSGSVVSLQIAKSRANELIAATSGYLSQISSMVIANTTYEIVAVGDIAYAGENKTTAVLTVRGVTTLPDGEVVYGSPKERTVTFAWHDDNSIESYA